VPLEDHSPPLEPRLAHVLRSAKLPDFATTRVWHEPSVAARKKEISSAAGAMLQSSSHYALTSSSYSTPGRRKD
jgi:hypothetical protein